MMKKIISILLVAAMLTLSGCSGNPQPTMEELMAEVNAEHQTVERFEGDLSPYLREPTESIEFERLTLFPEAEAEYKNSDSYNEALAETLLTRGEEKTELSYKLSNKKELDSDGLKDLEKSYKESYHKNVTIKKAVTMTAKLTETTDSGELSASREITVVKIENNWYIFGKVIEKFDLSQKG